ncbi:MAG: PD-(D/E)XK nuclease family protein [Bacteroidota bacterium]
MASQTSFLSDLASDLYDKHRHGIAQLTLILPNAWAGQVFKQCLAARLPTSVAPPNVLSLEAWIQQLSPLKQAQPLPLCYLLYQVFQELQPREASFEQFYFWGNVLLEDFDVIDKYLVDAVHLFTDLSKHKALSLSYDYLTALQKAAIQSFWKNFTQRLSTHQQGFLHLWKRLPQVYQHFGSRLRAQGIGYQGLCHRAAYETLLQGGGVPTQSRHLVFAGFNALTPIEEKLLIWHKEHASASFYWDVDAYYMEHAQQEAGLYLRQHREKDHFRSSFPSPLPKRIATGTQEICVTEVASAVGQVQVVRTQLQALMATQGANFVPGKTAIVVANEALHVPLLHALPLAKHQISAHLGYPLRDTITYRLLEYLLALQVAIPSQKYNSGYFTVRHVLMVLKHAHVMGCTPTQVKATIDHLQTSKHSYVAQDTLVGVHALYDTVFKIIGLSDCLVSYLIAVLQYVEVNIPQDMLRPLEKMALQQLQQQLGHLQGLWVTAPPKHEALLQLLRQLVQPIQLSLGEQALDGVQVLDVLATQALDFDHVFIVGMNEGHLPAQASLSSFIPYNLRKGYGLPTADQHQAALYAYHFYRLLQRAKQVYITYSTQTTADGQGEMSRYLLQLLYESKLRLKKEVVTHPIHLTKVRPITIHKKDAVLHQLRKYTLQSDGKVQSLTPSALNTYLDCSLRFYFQYLAKISTPKPPQEATHGLVFGNLLHQVMEQLYAPLLSKQHNHLLQTKDLEALHKNVPTVVQRVFDGMLRQHRWVAIQGEHAVARAVMTKLVNKILTLDQAHAPFLLIGLEMGRQVPLSLDFYLSPTVRVRLHGIIDRVDWKAGVFRVLDYKTGVDEKKIKSIASLFDRTAAKRNKAAFQTLFYAWLFHQKSLDRAAFSTFVPFSKAANLESTRIMPGLLNTRQIFEVDFDPRFFLQQADKRTYQPIVDMVTHQQVWEEGLRAILMDLLDPAVSFVQTDDVRICMSCPYKGICQRH